jgi:DNA modification methylase
MTALVLRADANRLPLADDSVDLIVTSPPYYAVRCYTDGGQALDGQLGQELTPHEFLDALIAATRECVRVLKPNGSLWVNLGDKYSGAQAQHYSGVSNRPAGDSASFWRRTDPRRTGIPNKSLMGLPWRYAIRCIDELGLILRAEVIWAKPNGLPESVRDRVRRSHEQWFHFVLQPRYYSAVDAIRETYSERVQARQRYADRDDVPRRAWSQASGRGDGNGERGILGFGHNGVNPLGKLPGSVWTIPSQPLRLPPDLGVDHFAAFPAALPRRIILGWSPPAICLGCGQGRRPQVVREQQPTGRTNGDRPRRTLADGASPRGFNQPGQAHTRSQTTIVGDTCDCPEPGAPTRPAVVLDVFGGTGTTALTASALGRTGISVDLSHDYCQLAAWRTHDPAQRARARGEAPRTARREPGKRKTA